MAMRKPGPYAPLSAHYADDEKIMAAGEDAELLYIRLLAYAARTPMTEGWVSDAVVQSRLGILPRPLPDGTGNDAGTDAGSRAGKLQEVGLIERDGRGWRIVAWLRWNRSIEEMGRERARDANRKKPVTSDDDGNDAGTDAGNGAGLPDASPLSDQKQIRSRSETGQPARGTRLPADFVITDDMRAWAVDKGHDKRMDLDAVTENFVDHWTAASGSKAAKRDWVAAWRTWIRNERTSNVRQLRDDRGSAASSLWDRGMPPDPCSSCNAPPELGHYDGCEKVS